MPMTVAFHRPFLRPLPQASPCSPRLEPTRSPLRHSVLAGCGPGRSAGRRTRRSLLVEAFSIDRRHHLELAWQRQLEQERLLSTTDAAQLAAAPEAVEARNAAHLERLLELSGGAVVVLALYSRSCGLCKEVLRELAAAVAECRRQRARVVFLKHDVMDEFDCYSDVARQYGVRSVPCTFFFVDGALVRKAGLLDSRQQAGTRSQVRSVLAVEGKRVRQTLFELLMKHTPGAR